MTSTKQIEELKKLNNELIQISLSKGSDYGNEDVLSNFKQVSLIVRELKLDIGTPEGYALLLVILKIARIANLTAKGKTPNNESIEDSYKDGINYFKLAYLNCIEKEELPSAAESFHKKYPQYTDSPLGAEFNAIKK